MSITPERTSVLRDIADILLPARRTGPPIQDLPEALALADREEAYYVQDVMAEAFGPVGGWKVASIGADAPPFFAPMPAAWIGSNGTEFLGPMHRLRGVECEIAFKIGKDLRPRETPYTREEVTAAIESCHPAIEIIESAYVDPLAVPRENMFADMQMHGGFVFGPAYEAWQTQDWSTEHVTLLIDGVVRVQNTNSAPGGPDLLRLVAFLVNELSARTGGLKRGDFVTTGSWTGVTWTSAGSEVIAEFANASRAVMTFAPEKP